MSGVTHYNVEAAMQQCIDTFQDRLRKVSQWKKDADRLDLVVATAQDWNAKMNARAEARMLRADIAKVDGGEYHEFLLDVMPIYGQYKDTFDNSKTIKKHKRPAATSSLYPLSTLGAGAKKGSANRGEIFRSFVQAISKYPCLNVITEQTSPDVYGSGEELYGFCPACKTNMIENSKEATLVCSACGMTSPVCENTERNVSYGTPVCATDYCYKRINHFNETLAQYHARERSVVPEDVMERLSAEFKKARITDKRLLTPCVVRKFLRKLRLSKYFEHSVQITHMFSGNLPPTMTQAQEEKLRSMFRMVQEPFEQALPKGRKNFLNYSYCIHKMCQLLEYDEFLSHFPLLKSKQKLWEQDDIWKNICKKLNWQFIPSK